MCIFGERRRETSKQFCYLQCAKQCARCWGAAVSWREGPRPVTPVSCGQDAAPWLTLCSPCEKPLRARRTPPTAGPVSRAGLMRTWGRRASWCRRWVPEGGEGPQVPGLTPSASPAAALMEVLKPFKCLAKCTVCCVFRSSA